MARIKLSALLFDIAGRYGGGIFRNWKGVHVLSMPPSNVHNPSTHKQARYREVFSILSKLWDTLDLATRDGWAQVAVYLSEIGDAGSYRVREGSGTMLAGRLRGPYTPIGAMIACHGLLASVGLWATTDPPADPPVGKTCPTPCDLTAVTGDVDEIDVAWTDPVSWGTHAHEGAIQIWARTEDGVFFPQLAGHQDPGMEHYTFHELTPRGVQGNELIEIEVGELLEVQVRPVNAEGLPGPASELGRIIVVAAP